MAKRLGFKPTLRDQLAANQRATAYYATMAGKPVPEPSIVLPEKRARSTPRDLEGPVVAAISELLAVHPRVVFACRQNSGMASYEAKSGAYAPVYFYRILTHGKELTIPDFWGILKDGRMLAVEAKAPGFTKPRNEREFKQANFLAMVNYSGGIGLFATSADDVANALR